MGAGRFMMVLKDILPPAKSTTSFHYDHSNDLWFKQMVHSAVVERSSVVKLKAVLPYLKRAGFIPRKLEDFGDGGAFPEIHIAQYPLDMGRNKRRPGSKVLPVTMDSHGNVVYDGIVKQNENASKIVYTQYNDLVPKIPKIEEKSREQLESEQKEIEETMVETQRALDNIINVRLSAAQPKNIPSHSSDPKYIKYKPSQQSAAFNSGAKERIIRMADMQVDPLEPPKFKHKRIPRASDDPPVPILCSPPRPVSVTDQQNWKIPPCISNWKNPKGYTIPLDKRLAADGRGLQEAQISDNFAKLAEALYVAENKSREAVNMRAKVQREMLMKQKEEKEQELRAIAQKARAQRNAPVAIPTPGTKDTSDNEKETKEEREDRLKREKIREERRRERERERRLEAKDVAMGKRSKITRDKDRDISEKVALGMASTVEGRGGEVMYDQRLFNQDKGIASGFATDDQYNVYDRGLFNAQPIFSTLYKPKKDMDDDTYGGADEQLDKIMKTDRFKPDKGFAGAESSGPRDRPVEFEKVIEEDPFGLDMFLNEVRTGKKAMESIGSGGTMRASGGSSMRDGHEGGSGRTRIGFERERH